VNAIQRERERKRETLRERREGLGHAWTHARASGGRKCGYLRMRGSWRMSGRRGCGSSDSGKLKSSTGADPLAARSYFPGSCLIAPSGVAERRPPTHKTAEPRRLKYKGRSRDANECSAARGQTRDISELFWQSGGFGETSRFKRDAFHEDAVTL